MPQHLSAENARHLPVKHIFDGHPVVCFGLKNRKVYALAVDQHELVAIATCPTADLATWQRLQINYVWYWGGMHDRHIDGEIWDSHEEAVSRLRPLTVYLPKGWLYCDMAEDDGDGVVPVPQDWGELHYLQPENWNLEHYCEVKIKDGFDPSFFLLPESEYLEPRLWVPGSVILVRKDLPTQSQWFGLINEYPYEPHQFPGLLNALLNGIQHELMEP